MPCTLASGAQVQIDISCIALISSQIAVVAAAAAAAAVSAAAAAEAGATAAAAAATAAAAAVAGAAASLRFFVTPTYVSTIADVASDIKMSFNEISLQTEKNYMKTKGFQ